MRGAGRFGLLQVELKRDEVIVLRRGIVHDDDGVHDAELRVAG